MGAVGTNALAAQQRDSAGDWETHGTTEKSDDSRLHRITLG